MSNEWKISIHMHPCVWNGWINDNDCNENSNLFTTRAYLSKKFTFIHFCYPRGWNLFIVYYLTWKIVWHSLFYCYSKKKYNSYFLWHLQTDSNVVLRNCIYMNTSHRCLNTRFLIVINNKIMTKFLDSKTKKYFFLILLLLQDIQFSWFRNLLSISKKNKIAMQENVDLFYSPSH